MGMTGGRRPEEHAPPRGGLEIHIGSLVFHGFSAGDQGRLRAAVARELGRLFDEGALPLRSDLGDGAARLDAGRFEISGRGDAEALGAGVARAIYRRLTGGGE